MNKRVIIIGAGGHSKVVADIVRENGDSVVGFLDDSYTEKREFYASSVIGRVSDYIKYKNDCEFIIAIGSNEVRKRISGELHCNWYTAIHPRAALSKSAKVGVGTCVMANAVINASASVGEHSIINTGSIIEHDCEIGSFTHIAPRSVVCGVTKVGECVWVGTGSTVINLINICDGVFIGAGGVVVKNITETGTYVGVPVRKMK